MSYYIILKEKKYFKNNMGKKIDLLLYICKEICIILLYYKKLLRLKLNTYQSHNLSIYLFIFYVHINI